MNLLQQYAIRNDTSTNRSTEVATTIATMAPGEIPLCACVFVSMNFGCVVVGNELGFDGTVWAEAGGVPVNEQTGNGPDPHRPSLPVKLW